MASWGRVAFDHFHEYQPDSPSVSPSLASRCRGDARPFSVWQQPPWPGYSNNFRASIYIRSKVNGWYQSENKQSVSQYQCRLANAMEMWIIEYFNWVQMLLNVDTIMLSDLSSSEMEGQWQIVEMRLGLQILNLILLSGSEGGTLSRNWFLWQNNIVDVTFSSNLISLLGEAGVPRLVEHPADVVVARDEPATLRCEAAGQPEPEIRWIKDGVEVRTAPSDPASHRVLLPSGALFFLKAVQNKKEDDRGTYWCVATNNDGEAVSRKAQLDIASKWPDSICNQSL